MQFQQLKVPNSNDSFLDLVKSPFYIDKTKYIKVFIESEEDAIQLNRPRRWGKTMALNMLSTFFQPNMVDIQKFTDNHTFVYDFKKGKRNWEIFQNLDISKDQEFMNSHLGQYPVININFKDLNQDNETLMLNSLKQMISHIYQINYYLYQRLEKMYKNEQNDHFKLQMDAYQEYLKGTNDNLAFSLRFLSQLLYEYFQKKVILLVDEYDNQLGQLAIKRLISKKDKYEQLTCLTESISIILRNCIKDNPYLKKVLITGVFDTLPRDQETGLENLIVLNLSSNQCLKLQQMVGITELEIKEFFSEKWIQICKGQNNIIQEEYITQFLHNLQYWNSGYELLNNHQYIFVYNPISVWNYFTDVLRFLVDNAKQFPLPKQYWVETESSNIFKKLLKIPLSQPFIKCLYELVKEDTLKLEPNQWLFPYLICKQKLTKQNYDNIFLGVLQQAGYLKISRNQKCFEFSNLEVAYDFKLRFFNSICDCLDLQQMYNGLPQKFFQLNKDKIIDEIQYNVLTHLKQLECKFDIKFYLKAYFTCLSINTQLIRQKRNIRTPKQNNKNINYILFPTVQSEQYQEKLLIHKYKIAQSKRQVKQELEKTIWSLYSQCYMSGYVSSKEWYCIILRAIVFYNDLDKGWKVEIAEFQHLNQVAQILLKHFFLKDEKPLENRDELKNTSKAREEFLKQYGCSNFKEFIKYFEFQEQNYQHLLTNSTIQENDNVIQQFDKMRISESSLDILEIIANNQIHKIQELLKYKEEYMLSLQVIKQIELKQSTKGIDIQQKRQEDRKNHRKYQIESQFERNRKRSNNK